MDHRMVYAVAVAVGQPWLYSSQPDPARALGVALLAGAVRTYVGAAVMNNSLSPLGPQALFQEPSETLSVSSQC